MRRYATFFLTESGAVSWTRAPAWAHSMVVSNATQQVRGLLAGLRYPAIPEHLADRIGAAIAAEAAIRAGGDALTRVVVSSSSGSELARQAAKARAESKLLHEDVRKLAELVGETEQTMATTLG